MALFLTVAMLIAVLSTSTVVAWEPLDSPAPPDGKFIVFDNFDMNIETSRWFPYGDLTHVFGSTAQDAWYEPRAKTNGASDTGTVRMPNIGVMYASHGELGVIIMDGA